MGGIQRSGPVGHLDETGPGSLQFADLPIDVVEVGLQQRNRVMAGGLALIPKFEDGGYLLESKACRLGVSDEPETLD